MAKKPELIGEHDTASELRAKAGDAMRQFLNHVEGWSDEDLRAVANRRLSLQSVEGEKACRALFVMELFRRTARIPSLAQAMGECT